MTVPDLYLEGLRQHALRGQEQLNVYKLGIVEAILKQALRAEPDQEDETLRSAMQTALDVARWEMRPERGQGRNTDSAQ